MTDLKHYYEKVFKAYTPQNKPIPGAGHRLWLNNDNRHYLSFDKTILII